MSGDPQMLAYAGLGVLAFIACVLAGLSWPFALWRSDSQERFADFLLIVMLPLIALAAYGLGLNHWLERGLRTLADQRSAYVVLAFVGGLHFLGNLTFPALVEIVTAVGAGALIAWLVRLLRWGVGKLTARGPAAAPADAPTIPQRP